MHTEIDVGKEFSDYLVNRNTLQGDGTFTAVEFRESFLTELEQDAWWLDKDKKIVLSFKNVKTLGPSWANEVFAYYTEKRKQNLLKEKIVFKDISLVKKEIINREIESGYAYKLN